jgi:hypothetical protein
VGYLYFCFLFIQTSFFLGIIMKVRNLRIAIFAIILVAGVALGVHLMHRDALAVTGYRVRMVDDDSPIEDLEFWLGVQFYNANGEDMGGGGGMEPIVDQPGVYQRVQDPPQGAVRWGVSFDTFDWDPVDPATRDWVVGLIVLNQGNDAGDWEIVPSADR